MQRDIDNFKDALQEVQVEEAFLPVVAPASTAYNGINEYYPSEKEYIYAIADALKTEYRAIVDAGLLVQVDDAVLANMYDHLVQTSPEHYRAVGAASGRRAESRAARASPRSASATTSASEAGTCRTSPTRRWRRWST